MGFKKLVGISLYGGAGAQGLLSFVVVVPGRAAAVFALVLFVPGGGGPLFWGLYFFKNRRFYIRPLWLLFRGL